MEPAEVTDTAKGATLIIRLDKYRLAFVVNLMLQVGGCINPLEILAYFETILLQIIPHLGHDWKTRKRATKYYI